MSQLELDLQRVVSLRQRYESRHITSVTQMTPVRRFLLDTAAGLWRELSQQRANA